MLGRLLGIAATLAGIASFVPLALIRGRPRGPGGAALGVLELLLGAFLLGAIWDGMVLGHWYLVERRLSNRTWCGWPGRTSPRSSPGVGRRGLSAGNPVPCEGWPAPTSTGCSLSFSPLLAVGSMTL